MAFYLVLEAKLWLAKYQIMDDQIPNYGARTMKHLDLELVDALADCQVMVDNESATEAIQEFCNLILKFWPKSMVLQYISMLDYPDVYKFIRK